MQLLRGDILIKNTKAGKTLWVSQRLLVQVCEVSEEYLRCRVRPMFKKSIQKGYRYGSFLPDTGKAWRWGRYKDQFYYEFDSIPDHKPRYYRSRFGTKAELIAQHEAFTKEQKQKKQDKVLQKIKTEVDKLIREEDIRYYLFQAPIGFTHKQAKDMATARAWCRFISRELTDDHYKKLGIRRIGTFYSLCTELIATRQMEGFRVNSAEYLRRKVDEFPYGEKYDRQVNYFISGKYGNDNAAIVGKNPIVDEQTGEVFQFDIHQAMMFHLYMNPGGSTKEYIHSLHQRYVKDIQQFGEEAVSYRTFCKHLTRFNRKMNLARARHGQDYYKKHVLTYVVSEKLKYSHSLFAGDGSGTFQYRYWKGGKPKTMKLYVITISDVASRKIVGYAFAKPGMHNETPEMVKDATKMSINNCGRQTMFEFISDNHGAFTDGESKDFLGLVFNKVRNIEPGNSQANPAETQFRLFKQSLKDLKNFASTSFNASNVESKSNPDHLDIEDLPSYEDAVIQFAEVVKRWNNSPLRDGVTPNERYENKHPECVPMEKKVLRYIYGHHTKVDLGYMRGYVKVSKTEGYEKVQNYWFDIPDYGGAGTELIAKATGYTTGAKVKVVWDEEMADLYTLDGKFILSCEPSRKSSQAEAETTEENELGLEHQMERKGKQQQYVDEFENNLVDIIDHLGYEESMAYGSNKEEFNAEQEEKESQYFDRLNNPESNENHNSNNPTKRRTDRDFNASEWDDLNLDE